MITINIVTAIVLEDEVTKVVTIYLDEIGGPIISGSNVEEAKQKFAEALSLGSAVRNLKFYEKAV